MHYRFDFHCRVIYFCFIRKYSRPCRIPDSYIISSTVIWAVTHLSIDRLERLRAICMHWQGPLAAAVWFPPHISNAERLEGYRALQVLLLDTKLFPMCQLKLVKVENYFIESKFPWRRVVVNSCVDAATRLENRNVKWIDPRLSPIPQNLYPVNAMRGIALDIVEEWSLSHAENKNGEVDFQATEVSALVFVIDVDFLPPKLLCQALCAGGPGCTDKLRQSIIDRCVSENKFVVIPAFEVTSNDNDVIKRLLAAETRYSLDNEWRTLHAKKGARAFHASSFFSGHACTNTEKWLHNVCVDNSSRDNFYTVEYRDDWEPYGFMTLKTLHQVGGYNRCFVGWHRDKIEFIRRISDWGMKFDVCCDSRAFILDWKPHEKCEGRVCTTQNIYYMAASAGLYRRCLNQNKAIKELSVEDAWKDPLSSNRNHEICSASSISTAQSSINNWALEPFFSSLRYLFVTSEREKSALIGSDVALKDVFWISDNNVKLFLSAETRSNIGYDYEKGIVSIPLTSAVMVPPMKGLAFSFKICLNYTDTACSYRQLNERVNFKTLTALGVQYDVRFPACFSWGHGGGVLPGLELVRFNNEKSSSYFPDVCMGRFYWSSTGAIRFKVTMKGKPGDMQSDFGLVTCLNRTAQLHRNCWHKLTVSAWKDGRIFSFVDDKAIYSSCCHSAFEMIQGVSFIAMSEREEIPSDDFIEFRDISIAGNIDTNEDHARDECASKDADDRA